jgi:CheY-like chemotaxis protein
MKPKRVILCLEHAAQIPVLRLVLQTNGYRVLTVNDVGAAISAWQGIDLVVIGPGIRKLDESQLPIASLRIQPGMTMQQMLERMRVLLIRKRGPKKPVASSSAASGPVAMSGGAR